MKITNIEDINTIEQELLEALEGFNNIENKTEEQKVDSRWLAIARTDLEKGFMAFRRALGE